MRRDVSEQISVVMIAMGAKLDEMVALVQNSCPSEDFIRFRRAVGQIMGIMLLDIMNPIYSEWPDIKPPQLE